MCEATLGLPDLDLVPSTSPMSMDMGGPNWVPSKWENPEKTGHDTSQWFHSPLTIETHHSQTVS